MGPNTDVYMDIAEYILGPFVILALRQRVGVLTQDGTPEEVRQRVKEFADAVFAWASSVSKGGVSHVPDR